MTEACRIAVLTLNGGSHLVGGVEVFNQYLQRALGSVEIFGDGRPEPAGPHTNLSRIGLEQPYRALRAGRVLMRRHREKPFDLIISNGVSGWPLTLTDPGVPLVQVYHFTMAGLAKHALPLKGDRLTTGRIAAFFDRLAGVGKHVVAVSAQVSHEVESIYGLRSHCIPNAVDTTVFRPIDRRAARDALGLPQGARIGIFVGRPEHAKGYDLLVRVAERMPDVTFLGAGVPGEGHDNMRPLGRVPHEEMPLWYSASDFFFLPSRYEGFSLSLLEALSCDRPAVVSQPACPFPEEFVECGIVVAGEGEQGFVDAIREVTTDRQLSPRSFVVPRFDFAVIREVWRDLVETLVGREPTAVSSAHQARVGLAASPSPVASDRARFPQGPSRIATRERHLAVCRDFVSDYLDGHSMLLEVGSAAAPFSHLPDLIPCRRLSLDVDLESLQRAAIESGAGKDAFVAGDGHHIPVRDEMVDGIVAFFVVEHLREPVRFLEEARRVLRPGGFVFVVTPSVANPFFFPILLIPLRLREKLLRVIGGHPDHQYLTYLRANTMNRLSALASKTGFRLVRSTLLWEDHYFGKLPGGDAVLGAIDRWGSGTQLQNFAGRLYALMEKCDGPMRPTGSTTAPGPPIPTNT